MRKKRERKVSDNTAQCEWCKDEERSVHCRSLCRRCYTIERTLAIAEAAFASAPLLSHNKWRYQVAKRMKELAIWEGEQYGNIGKQEVDGMRIEMELRFLSERFVGKEMFWGCSDAFDWDFKTKQRRILLQYIASMMRQYLQKRRYIIACNSAHLEKDWEEFI